MSSSPRPPESSAASLCKCGHPKSEHDYFGCLYVSCQGKCGRRYGSTEGKRG